MNILMLTPVPPEFHAARELFGAAELSRNGRVRTARLRRKAYSLTFLCTGPGAARVEQALGEAGGGPWDWVVDSGSCGSLRDDLPPGSLLRGELLFRPAEGALKAPPFPGDTTAFRSAALLERDRPLFDEALRDRCRREFGADACTMESYAAAEWALSRSVPWVSLRVVTDGASSRGGAEFKKNVRSSSLLLYHRIRESFAGLF